MKQAVLVIDFQQELVDGNTEERPVYLKEQVAHVIEAVVLEADERNIPIVFIRDLDVAGGIGPGFAVHDSIPVPASSVTFDKAATNAFHDTPLLDYLRQASIEHLIVLGCKTEQMIAHHNQVLHGHYNVEHFAIVRPSTEDVFTPTHNDYRT